MLDVNLQPVQALNPFFSVELFHVTVLLNDAKKELLVPLQLNAL